MIKVTIDSVRASLLSQHRVVVLKEEELERYLAIWIGPYEADAITIKLQGVEVARPLTHDLLQQSISKLGAKVSHILVNDLHDDTFYARVVMDRDGERIEAGFAPQRCHRPGCARRGADFCQRVGDGAGGRDARRRDRPGSPDARGRGKAGAVQGLYRGVGPGRPGRIGPDPTRRARSAEPSAVPAGLGQMLQAGSCLMAHSRREPALFARHS